MAWIRVVWPDVLVDALTYSHTRIDGFNSVGSIVRLMASLCNRSSAWLYFPFSPGCTRGSGACVPSTSTPVLCCLLLL